MRARNSARERADAAADVPAGGADGRNPRLRSQCSVCLRWLSRERLCVVPVGEDDICGLRAAVSMVESCIPTTEVTDSEEEAAIATLRFAYNLLRPRAP